MIVLLVYGAIVGALALSTIRHPATAIAGVICVFGLEQWAQGSHLFFVQHQSITNYIIGFIVLLGLAKKIYRGQPILSGYPAVGLLVFTLFLYALVSTRWAPYPEQSLSGLLSQGPYIITNIFLSPLLFSNGEDLSRALRATLALGAVLVFLLLFTVEWEYRSIVFPGADHNGNPAAIGSLGGTIFLLAAYFTWNRFKLLNVLKWVVVILGLMLAIRSGSRGQALGAVIALLAFWPVAYPLRNLRAYLLLGLGIVLIAVAISWGVDTFWSGSKRWTEEGMADSADGRLYRSAKIYEYWFTTPATIFFGVGNSASRYLIGTYAHVLPADILCEEGIAGL
ncbi:MAG: hypothetical protein MN733_11000, partial [Nitrososphaera sp.]|nr:hypothetical protein [Nitrososphaera sp.]